jgi:hypothetical protein
MIRSKFIPITIAAFCGLAFHLQASAAHAQTSMGGPPLSGIQPWADLQPGNSLFVGFAMRSYNGNLLILQQDGNLVLKDPSYNLLWSTQTYGAFPIALTMQTDCNLVLYGYPQGTSGGPPQQLWASNTSNNVVGASCFLRLDQFANLEILRPSLSGGFDVIKVINQ